MLAETRLFTDGETYVILRLPLHQHAEAARMLKGHEGPFIAMVHDKDEITLVLTTQLWETVRPGIEATEESPDYRLITFDLPLDLGLVGYLATLTAALAEAGISIFAISAFSRDHILAPAEDFDRAWDTLRDLIRTCQVGEANETS